jgi:DNA processing protein
MPCISIVGSRAASTYGLRAARRLACGLADKGFCIVSGMARGIDTAAHLGALDSTGKTIAVLGSGLKKYTPGKTGTYSIESNSKGQ